MSMPLFAVLLALCGVSNDYSDPSGAFALSVPDGWSADRTPLDSQTTLFEFGAGESGPHITITTVDLGSALDPSKLEMLDGVFTQAFVQQLNEEGQVLTQRTTTNTFNGMPSRRCDITYRAADGVFEGYSQSLVGKRFFVSVIGYWPQGNATDKSLVEKHLATFALETNKPGKGKSEGLLTKSALTQVAANVKGNLVRETSDSVLVPGEPPLTVGSVVGFVEVIHELFGVELTETEFEMTKERFIEYYRRNDAQGKQILALGGKRILEQLTQGPSEQREKNRKEAKDVFEDRLKGGAQAGSGWAQALWEAIQRRQRNLLTVSAKKPQGLDSAKADNEVSEGDLEAALEMLYFMWVASGRDPAMVTPEAVAQVRMLLVSRFNQFDPQLQWALANAQQVYSSMRAQWMSANAAQRAQLARSYGQTLDWLGLTVKPAGGGQSAWSDVAGTDSSTLHAELIQNSAFLATNSWQR